jgi:hypothetical protein
MGVGGMLAPCSEPDQDTTVIAQRLLGDGVFRGTVRRRHEIEHLLNVGATPLALVRRRR